ncbi:MAG: hypothetical protein V7641_4929 [Blastocatellia bacterium]
MAQMIVDPEELLHFASFLDTESEHLRQRMDAIHHDLASLGEDWRDDKFRKFAAIFERSTNKLGHFLEEAHEYADYLRHQADVVFEYLDHGYPE